VRGGGGGGAQISFKLMNLQRGCFHGGLDPVVRLWADVFIHHNLKVEHNLARHLALYFIGQR